MPPSTSTLDSSGVARAIAHFTAAFPDAPPPTAATASPGRVNVIGEHTDYCDGFVLPLAIDKSTYIVGVPSTDGQCHVSASAFPDAVGTFTPGADAPDGLPKWARYVFGMTAVYARAGHKVTPFTAAVVSEVPLGGGLSSSAALEMATAVLMEVLGGYKVDAAERAVLGQQCEHEFAGVPCGIMDQMICSKGEDGKVLLIDCRTHDCEPIPFNDPDTVLVVANSNVEHDLSGSEYPARRKATEDAAKAMAAKFPDAGIKLLRDCSLEMLEAVKDEIGDETATRARHVIEENRRVLEAKKALIGNDLEQFGKLMHESHVSLRDLYEVSTKEIDGLVEMAMKIEGVYGARITGGGFGGCSVTLVKKDAVPALMAAFDEGYPAISGGKKASVFATTAGPGARVVSLP